MQCIDCKKLRHDGPCELQPTDLDMLEAAKDQTFANWVNLIGLLPIVGRTEEQQGQIDGARTVALATRDKYLEAISH